MIRMQTKKYNKKDKAVPLLPILRQSNFKFKIKNHSGIRCKKKSIIQFSLIIIESQAILVSYFNNQCYHIICNMVGNSSRKVSFNTSQYQLKPYLYVEYNIFQHILKIMSIPKISKSQTQNVDKIKCLNKCRYPASSFGKQQRFNDIHSERSDECIDFTMLCFFFVCLCTLERVKIMLQFQTLGFCVYLVGAFESSFFEFPNSFQKRREKPIKINFRPNRFFYIVLFIEH
ncbi:Uncharacterized protein FWK35_00002684, partial [Aphis craccivora]